MNMNNKGVVRYINDYNSLYTWHNIGEVTRDYIVP